MSQMLTQIIYCLLTQRNGREQNRQLTDHMVHLLLGGGRHAVNGERSGICWRGEVPRYNRMTENEEGDGELPEGKPASGRM